ncbi:MAG: hypothetical protein ABI253_16855 [Mycobacterium sp.]
MATNTIVLIVIAVIAALVVLAVIGWAMRNKRAEARRGEARSIRDKAGEHSHEVGQREALADETAAKSRAAQAEAEAMAARAAGLQHQAEQRHSDAVDARREVNQEYDRADKVDPGVKTGDKATGDKARAEAESHGTPTN